MSDVMTDRERIAVTASDTLERVLERVRASEAPELVLDVDERSPLLISLQHLHSLDEVAQDRGVQVTIATANSKLLNAARVFGLEVLDTRGAAPAVPPAPGGRLLAGEPLGRADLDEHAGEEPTAPSPAPERPVVRVTPVARPQAASKPLAGAPLAVAPRPVPKPGRPLPPDEEPEEETAAEVVAVAEEAPAPPPKRNRRRPAAQQQASTPVPPVPAPPPQRVERIERVEAPRLDPYGQPYAESFDDDEEDAAPAGQAGRTIRPLRPNRERRAAPAPIEDDVEDGWDDEPTYYAEDEFYGEERRRPGLRDSVAGFWADVRAWVDARRGIAPADVYDDEPELADAPGDIDGWDEPPYRARRAGRQIDVTELEDAPPAAEPEMVDAPELAATPPRPLRRVRPVPDEDEGPPAFDAGEAAQLRPFVATVTTYDEDDEDFDRALAGADWRPRRAGRGGARFAIGGLVGVIIALSLVVLLALYVILPSATVTLVARTGTVPVEFNLVVGEIDPNSPEGRPTQQRIVVPAKRITVPLKATSTKPATGARLEPDVTAGGPVVLTNPSTSAVTVAKGTTLTGTDGRSYVTLEGITIGPADPFGAGAFGSATVNVAAGIKGSGGNAPVGAVQGQLASGVYYTNKTAPIAGGSDRRITTIAQQDLAAAQAAAEAAVRGQGQGALNSALPAGSVVMHDTAGVGHLAVTFNAQAGADGDSVTATVTAETTALVYLPGEVEAQARAEAERRLAAGVKPGEPIVAGSAQIDAPQLVEDVPGQLTYKITANARTRAAIGGDAERARLANDLARKDDDEAHRVIAALPGVSSSSIAYDTWLFPHRMPWLASNITIRIADGQ